MESLPSALVTDHGLLGDASNAHDGDVGLVDDGQTEHSAELAWIGDGEGGAFDVGRHELLRARALTEIGDAALEAEEVEFVAPLRTGTMSPQSSATAMPALTCLW